LDSRESPPPLVRQSSEQVGCGRPSSRWSRQSWSPWSSQ
jgi:hypothetical protein